MTGDAHTAEDLTQEAFLRVFARRRTYEATARFSTFLWRVALNLCYDHLRRAGWDVERLADDAAPAMLGLHSPSPRADACLERQERAEWVQGALIRLPTPYRVVVVLRHYEGLRFREIAEVLGVPEGTVKSRMAEALHRLAKLLQPIVQEYMDVPRRPRG
jgi:RNA polymerase sigma-70 factor (ECF subfamily)